MAINLPGIFNPYATQMAQANLPSHSHTVTQGPAPRASTDEICPCCNGQGIWHGTTNFDPNRMYAGQASVPFSCQFCSGKGAFKPTDLQYQPVKMYKVALARANEIEAENKKLEEARKQRLTDQIKSKLTEEELEFIQENKNANRRTG